MDLPEKRFRLRPGHFVWIIDLAVLAGLFLLGGKLYMSERGVKVVAAKQEERAAVQLEGVRLLQEADSVVAVTEGRLAAALQDSTQAIQELQDLRFELDRRIEETQRLSQGIYALSDVVLDMRRRAEMAIRQAQRDEADVREREAEVDSLRATALRTHELLVQKQREREEALATLAMAQQQERYDPKGRFPDRTGLMVRQDINDEIDTTNLLLEHVLWKRGRTDVGVSLGWGLGRGEPSSSKEIGLVVSRSLVHRRIGLDFSAGLAQLTRPQGEDDRGAYAAAGLRISPFYAERLHLGLGARAFRDEIVPYLGFSVGRR